MNYNLGSNPLAKSYVTGYGTNTPVKFFSHIYSSDDKTTVPKGYQIQGPNQWEGRPYSRFNAKAYDDTNSDWTVSEQAIYYNSRLVFITALLKGEATTTFCSGAGTITRDLWTGIGGTKVSDVPVTTTPNSTGTLTSFEGPIDVADSYGSRIRGYLCPPTTGSYTFWVASDDNSQLKLSTNNSPSNATIIARVDEWTNSRQWTKYTSQQSGAVPLNAGQQYYIEVVQKEGGGGDNAAVAWQGPGISRQVIPGSALLPYNDGSVSGTGLSATYYDNMDFTGTSVTRTDPTVDFPYGSGSPDSSIGADTFSARWTGTVQPQYSETYTFYTQSDDGVRLWVHGQQLINNWTDHGSTEDSGTISLQAGQKYTIRMEFYENGWDAIAQLRWSSASQPKEIIPQNRLYPQ